jgi:uncharacterized protein YndB with AHSA1/START domain
MPPLFVDKLIEISAPAHNVWDALTQATQHWIGNFGMDGAIESDWKLGSPVYWKNKDGTVIVEGTVTAVEPEKLLRFTVFDVRSEKPPVTDEDGITYQLSAHGSRTTLRIRQGDFSAMPDGAKFRDMSAEIWDRVMLKVKELAEGELTCGKGLAQSATLPEKIGDVMAAMADMLAAHMTALDVNDPNGRREYDAYDSLVQKYRRIAAQLAAAANEMDSYWGLPMAGHDMEAMMRPKMRETFAKLARDKRALLDLLQETTVDDQKMLDGW